MDPFAPSIQEKQALMAQILRGQQAVAENSRNANQFNTLAAATQLANNPAAAAAAAAADKAAQKRYGVTQLGNTGVMLDATGESASSAMYAEDKLDSRAQARGLQAERLAAQQELASQRIDASRQASADRNALALTIAGMRRTDKAAADAAKADKPGKTLSFSAIDKLSRKQGVSDSFDELVTGFKPEFSGTPVIAGLENTMGRYAPKISGKGDQSNWWQNYMEQSNAIRHELFGSALTATEKKSFEDQTIMPGMDAGEISRRLAQQNRAARKAAAKLIEATGKSGYDVTGFEIGDIPEAPLPGGKPAAAGAPAGVDPAIWQHMTPEERKLWAN